MNPKVRRALVGLAAAAVTFTVLAPQALAQRPAFDLKLGIIGNLAPQCAEQGKCDFCDFIDLFVVLQKVILSLFGGLALIMILWAGQSIITAAGNQEKVTAAKKLITSTLLGILAVLAGYILIMFLVTLLISPSSGMQSGVFTSLGPEFWNAYCKAPKQTDADYCQKVPQGTSCDEGKVCWNGRCGRLTCESIVGDINQGLHGQCLAKPANSSDPACGGNRPNLNTERFCKGDRVCCVAD